MNFPAEALRFRSQAIVQKSYAPAASPAVNTGIDGARTLGCSKTPALGISVPTVPDF